MEKIPNWLWWSLGGIVIIIFIAGSLLITKPGSPRDKTAEQCMEKFLIPPCDEKGECEEVPTVHVGPGTIHRIRADAPYKGISTKKDGKRVFYDMPAGWETVTGGANAGIMRLVNIKGAKKDVLVEIIRVQ